MSIKQQVCVKTDEISLIIIIKKFFFSAVLFTHEEKTMLKIDEHSFA